MFIRIKFDNIESAETKETQQLFFGIPSGTCLSSSNAHQLSSKQIKEIVGISAGFWYLDIDILNKYYGGVLSCLNGLLTYPGVSRIDILPIEENYNTCIEHFDKLEPLLMKYVNGV